MENSQETTTDTFVPEIEPKKESKIGGILIEIFYAIMLITIGFLIGIGTGAYSFQSMG